MNTTEIGIVTKVLDGESNVYLKDRRITIRVVGKFRIGDEVEIFKNSITRRIVKVELVSNREENIPGEKFDGVFFPGFLGG